MSLFGNLFGRRPSSPPADAPAAFRAFAAEQPAGGLARILLERAAASLDETAASLSQQGMVVQPPPAPASPAEALITATVMAAQGVLYPAIKRADYDCLTLHDGQVGPATCAFVLTGMLVTFNLACQVQRECPDVEPQEALRSAFQAFALALDESGHATLAPKALDGFQRVFSGDEPSRGQLSQQAFEMIVLMIGHLQGDERIRASALEHEVIALFPMAEQVFGDG